MEIGKSEKKEKEKVTEMKKQLGIVIYVNVSTKKKDSL